MSDISFAVQVIPDKFQLHGASIDASLDDVLPEILRSAIGHSTQEEIDIKNYRVLIAYQLTNPDVNVKKIALDTSAPVSTQGFTIRDLKLKNGFFLFFVRLPVTIAKLELVANGKRLALLDGQDNYLLGRKDPDRNIDPKIDITKYLSPDNENRVSRQQAIIFLDDGRWRIKLHDEARTSVFLNNERLEDGRVYDIKDDTAINLGSDFENPLLRILTRLIAE